MAIDKWMRAEVTTIIDETWNTKRFIFKVPELQVFNFNPGQFITLDLPISEKKTRRLRSYSIASAPDGSNTFELIISHAPHGTGTNYLWNEMKPGAAVNFKGPSGIFTFPKIIHTELCMIATGTGIAPFRSMLINLKNTATQTSSIHLVFGTRYLKDLLYKNEMEKLQFEFPKFRYHFILSREHDPSYTGSKGYVHDVYEKLYADRRPAHFYLCGWKSMVDEAKERIVAMGYEKKHIHLELYG